MNGRRKKKEERKQEEGSHLNTSISNHRCHQKSTYYQRLKDTMLSDNDKRSNIKYVPHIQKKKQLNP
jgi:hypothetical protein